MIQGVCPVLEVPFTAAGDVDYDGFDRVTEHVMGTGVGAVMFPGFASEFPKLDDAERTRLTGRLLRAGNAHGVPVVVSVPDHATVVAIRRAREAIDAGAAAINILPPHVFAPAPAQVRRHVEAVLDAVAGTPVVLQYAPAQTGTALDAETIRAFAERHGAGLQVKVEVVPPGPVVSALAAGPRPVGCLIGYAGVHLLDGLRRGAVGVQPGCSFVEVYVEIWRLWHAGRIADAEALHRRLLPYIAYWMQHVELIVQAEKTISRRRGLIADDHCRMPGRPLDGPESAEVDRFLEEFADLLAGQGSGGSVVTP
ncbi:dihydrodipicolinate synthase family protein [Pseudonocardia adelaidensis]|uniref:Dihydrodipicolinate synthase family protein n=1 Tax=Pseudonocardia adelaidensis TaxID=648754 RepID=A0ABP9NDZ2_9PSEU